MLYFELKIKTFDVIGNNELKNCSENEMVARADGQSCSTACFSLVPKIGEKIESYAKMRA